MLQYSDNPDTRLQLGEDVHVVAWAQWTIIEPVEKMRHDSGVRWIAATSPRLRRSPAPAALFRRRYWGLFEAQFFITGAAAARPGLGPISFSYTLRSL